jgi:hypothetical protein
MRIKPASQQTHASETRNIVQYLHLGLVYPPICSTCANLLATCALLKISTLHVPCQQSIVILTAEPRLGRDLSESESACHPNSSSRLRRPRPPVPAR